MPALNRLLPKPALPLEGLADSCVLSAGAEGPTLVADPISAVLTGLLLGVQVDGNCSVTAFIPVLVSELAHLTHRLATCPEGCYGLLRW